MSQHEESAGIHESQQLNSQSESQIEIMNEKKIRIDTSFLNSQNDIHLQNDEVACSEAPSPTGTLRTLDSMDEEAESSLQISNLPSNNTKDPLLVASPATGSQHLKAIKSAARYQHWQSHTHAVGNGPISWMDEEEDEDLSVYMLEPDTENLVNCDAGTDSRIQTIQESVSHCANAIFNVEGSSLFCKRFGRIGNMVILKEREAWISVPTHDGDSNGMEPIEDAVSVGPSQRQFQLVLGPFWPTLFCFTIPAIVGFSAFTAVKVFFQPGHTTPFILFFIWTVSTLDWIIYLLRTSFVDPGILTRHKSRPAKTWRWNDNAQSYIPQDAVFEPDCNVVIEEYDHTCMYTGTAVGKNNTKSFRLFVFFTIFCIVEDIALLLIRP